MEEKLLADGFVQGWFKRIENDNFKKKLGVSTAGEAVLAGQGHHSTFLEGNSPPGRDGTHRAGGFS